MLPNDMDPPKHKRRAFQEVRKSTNMEGELGAAYPTAELKAPVGARSGGILADTTAMRRR
jgi:hypothetical protein